MIGGEPYTLGLFDTAGENYLLEFVFNAAIISYYYFRSRGLR